MKRSMCEQKLNTKKTMIEKKCYICSDTDFEKVEGKVRGRPEMTILRCAKCGLVFLENFDHIDESFYQDSKMRVDTVQKDWEVYIEKGAVDDMRRAEWMTPKIKNKSVLDFGCGSGGFLSRIKDSVTKCAGIEKDIALKNIIEKEFHVPIYSEIDEIDESFDYITLFHVLEHLKDPKSTLLELSKLLTEKGRIIIEVPNANDALLSLYKCKAFSEFTYWECHLYLFTNDTLRRLVEDTGLKVEFIDQVQRYPLSNHLYWLAKGQPGGHEQWGMLNNGVLNEEYMKQLRQLNICDTIISSIKK